MNRILFLFAILVSQHTFAATHPINLSLVPKVAIFGPEERIEGFILSIWGQNPQSAFAIGFVNGSTGDSSGVSLGLVNYTETYTGAHLGTVNWATKKFTGLQWGFVNYAKNLHGVQLGFFNYAANADGAIQIGLINIMEATKTWFSEFPKRVSPFMIIANWRF